MALSQCGWVFLEVISSLMEVGESQQQLVRCVQLVSQSSVVLLESDTVLIVIVILIGRVICRILISVSILHVLSIIEGRSDVQCSEIRYSGSRQLVVECVCYCVQTGE